MSIFVPGLRLQPDGPGRFPEKNNSYGNVKIHDPRHQPQLQNQGFGTVQWKKVNTLVGVSGLIKMVNDIELTNRLLDRAFATMEDKVVCKLRRGLKISFYVA